MWPFIVNNDYNIQCVSRLNFGKDTVQKYPVHSMTEIFRNYVLWITVDFCCVATFPAVYSTRYFWTVSLPKYGLDMLYILIIINYERLQAGWWRISEVTSFDDRFWWQVLVTRFGDKFWWDVLVASFGDKFWWQVVTVNEQFLKLKRFTYMMISYWGFTWW